MKPCMWTIDIHAAGDSQNSFSGKPLAPRLPQIRLPQVNTVAIALVLTRSLCWQGLSRSNDRGNVPGVD